VWRTPVNASKQALASPPFGSAEYLLRTPPDLKQGYKQLEAFSLFPVYSNAATALQPIDQRKKGPVAMQHRKPGESSKGLTPTCSGWKQYKITPLLSNACVKRIDEVP
jgi:hypothetical protein